MRPDPRARRGPRGDRGSATVEVAIVLPIVMLLLMLVVQAGIYFHTRAVVATAAHKGADAVRVEDGSLPAGRAVTEAFLARNAPALDERTVVVGRSGDRAEVTVSGHVVSLLFGVDLFPVRVTAEGPLEEVTP